MNKDLYSHFKRHVWQPFTQMKLLGEPPLITEGKGSLLITSEGQQIIDAIGSWWVNIHGHANPVINKAISDQTQKLEHAIFAGLAHEPGILLSKKLSEVSDHNLPRCYFSDNGSTGVEIALKMAFQYFHNLGKPKKQKFISLKNGYHGDTIGTMSVGDRGVFHELFKPLLFDSIYVNPPIMEFGAWNDQGTMRDPVHSIMNRSVESLEKILKEQSEHICAMIFEPIVQGASGGFAMYPPAWLKEVRRLCTQYDVLMIADEVFTGVGRTGQYFACNHARIWPDIMVVAKGLSGGYLPIAATLCSEKIFEAFYSDDRRHTLFHGHSMTANPLACAASLASLQLMDDQDCLATVATLQASHFALTRGLSDKLKDHIIEIRILGSICAIELSGTGQYTSEFGWQMMNESIKRGVLLRPLGNVIYMTPPYCIKKDELEKCYGVLEEVLLAAL